MINLSNPECGAVKPMYFHRRDLDKLTVWRLIQGFTRHLALADQPHISRSRHVEEPSSFVHGSSILLAVNTLSEVYFKLQQKLESDHS